MADLDIETQRMPAGMYAHVPGPYWLVSVGRRAVAVVHDPLVAERIHDLLVAHGLVDLDSLAPEDAA